VLSAELTAYVSDRIALLLLFREQCLFGSGAGKFHTQTGFGINITIN